MDALPFIPYVPHRLVSIRPDCRIPEPKTIGEHIKRARTLQSLKQSEAGELLGVSASTVLHWEKGITEPQIVDVPAVVRFLGYDPYPVPQTLPERMLAKRRAHGWSIAQAAQTFGVDDGTWGVWERGEVKPWPRYLKQLGSFLQAVER